MNSQPTESVLQHTGNIKSRLQELMNHLRKDVTKVDDPKAQALFETSAEVLGGLVKAFSDFEQRTEAAWQTPGKADHNAWPAQDKPLK